MKLKITAINMLAVVLTFCGQPDWQASESISQPRTEFSRLLDSWYYCSETGYLGFIDEVQPEESFRWVFTAWIFGASRTSPRGERHHRFHLTSGWRSEGQRSVSNTSALNHVR